NLKVFIRKKQGLLTVRLSQSSYHGSDEGWVPRMKVPHVGVVGRTASQGRQHGGACAGARRSHYGSKKINREWDHSEVHALAVHARRRTLLLPLRGRQRGSGAPSQRRRRLAV